MINTKENISFYLPLTKTIWSYTKQLKINSWNFTFMKSYIKLFIYRTFFWIYWKNFISAFSSDKGCSYDNAVAETQFKIIKTEFVHSRRFENSDNYSSENLYRKVLPIQLLIWKVDQKRVANPSPLGGIFVIMNNRTSIIAIVFVWNHEG